MKPMRIGEVARRAEVGIETIRYYEREGLLAASSRRPSGYREFDDSVVARLQFIKRTKELGFTLAEIKELLGLWFNSSTKCVHVRERATDKIADIEGKIQSLQKMKRTLKKLVSQCETKDVARRLPASRRPGRPPANHLIKLCNRKGPNEAALDFLWRCVGAVVHRARVDRHPNLSRSTPDCGARW